RDLQAEVARAGKTAEPNYDRIPVIGSPWTSSRGWLRWLYTSVAGSMPMQWYIVASSSRGWTGVSSGAPGPPGIVESGTTGCTIPARRWRPRIRQTTESQLTLEEVNDPAVIARCRTQDERVKRNSDWLQAHWAELLPQARGKFVAVAGQEAFIADTADTAWR